MQLEWPLEPGRKTLLVETGEQRHRHDPHAGPGRSGTACRRPDHLLAAGRMHGEELGAEASRRRRRALDRVRDVVKLEIEEHAPAPRAERPHRVGTRRGEEL